MTTIQERMQRLREEDAFYQANPPQIGADAVWVTPDRYFKAWEQYFKEEERAKTGLGKRLSLAFRSLAGKLFVQKTALVSHNSGPGVPGVGICRHRLRGRGFGT